MKNYTYTVLFFLFFGASHSQDSEPLIFKGCETADNQESCSILKLSKIISTHLNTSILPYEVKEDEELVLSIRLHFWDDGMVRENWSIIYNSVQNSHDEFEPVLKNIPLTLTAIESQNENRLKRFTGFFTFKKRNGTFKITAISNEASEDFEIKEKVPVYKGCKAKWANEKIIKCNSKKINTYFKSNFKSENLDFKYYVDGEILNAKVVFFLETDGSITISKIDVEEETFAKEIKRIITNFKAYEIPGSIGSKKIRVPQNLPIKVVYQN